MKKWLWLLLIPLLLALPAHAQVAPSWCVPFGPCLAQFTVSGTTVPVNMPLPVPQWITQLNVTANFVSVGSTYTLQIQTTNTIPAVGAPTWTNCGSSFNVTTTANNTGTCAYSSSQPWGYMQVVPTGGTGTLNGSVGGVTSNAGINAWFVGGNPVNPSGAASNDCLVYTTVGSGLTLEPGSCLGAGGVTASGSPVSGNPAVFSASTVIRPATSGDSWPGNAATATALAATPAQCPAGQVATGVTAAGVANCVSPVTTPAWLMNIGQGATSNTTASGNMVGDYFYINFTVPYGNTVTVNNWFGLTIHAQACIVAGTINANGAEVATGGGNNIVYYGGSGGGGGGGTGSGAAGSSSHWNPAGASSSSISGGAGGTAASQGSNGSSVVSWAGSEWIPLAIQAGSGSDGLTLYNGAAGGIGYGNATAAVAGGAVNLICGTFTGTDGTHTGSIDVSGQAGSGSTGNSVGGNGGGGGGVINISSGAPVSTWPTTNIAGGAGGTCGAFTGCGAGGQGGSGILNEVVW